LDIERGQATASLKAWTKTMRDIIDDGERKLRPLPLLMMITACTLGSLIVYNAIWGKGTLTQSQLIASVPAGATTHVEVTVPTSDNTVVIKYDPVIEDAQRELLALGQYNGMVDGVNGQRTKSAIQQYQQANGLPVTGEVSSELINHLRYTHKVKTASETTGSIDSKPASKTIDQSHEIMKVQMALSQLGFDAGAPTGSLNDATHAAILQFEMNNGLAMDGVIDKKLVDAVIAAANQ
jgi:peptidoglycan hydrolase-like protein with peptidoglycan-binding domain